MICPFCKNQIDNDSKFCPECGQIISMDNKYSKELSEFWDTVNHEMQQNAEARLSVEANIRAKQKTRKIIFSVVLIIGLSLGIAAMCFGFAGKLTADNTISGSSLENKTDSEGVETEKNTDIESTEITAVEPTRETVAVEDEPNKETDRVLNFIINSDHEYLTKDDLQNFDADMCRYARNGIYARMGRKFMDETLTEYFNQYDWYNPTIEPDNFSESLFNSYQIANLELIVSYEEEHGYR